MKMPFFFKKSAKKVTHLKYQNFLQLMEPRYINLTLRDASIISSGFAKSKLGLLKRTKSEGKSFICLIFNSDWPVAKGQKATGEFVKNTLLSKMKKSMRKANLQLILQECVLFMTMQLPTSVIWFRISWKQKLWHYSPIHLIQLSPCDFPVFVT